MANLAHYKQFAASDFESPSSLLSAPTRQTFDPALVVQLWPGVSKSRAKVLFRQSPALREGAWRNSFRLPAGLGSLSPGVARVQLAVGRRSARLDHHYTGFMAHWNKNANLGNAFD